MGREQSIRWYIKPFQTKISRRVVGAWVSESERQRHRNTHMKEKSETERNTEKERGTHPYPHAHTHLQMQRNTKREIFKQVREPHLLTKTT